MAQLWCAARSNPVREITDAARQITSYNLGRRLPVARTDDELQGLSVVLNQMIGRLDEAFQHSRRYHRRCLARIAHAVDDHARGTGVRLPGTRS